MYDITNLLAMLVMGSALLAAATGVSARSKWIAYPLLGLVLLSGLILLGRVFGAFESLLVVPISSPVRLALILVFAMVWIAATVIGWRSGRLFRN